MTLCIIIVYVAHFFPRAVNNRPHQQYRKTKWGKNAGKLSEDIPLSQEPFWFCSCFGSEPNHATSFGILTGGLAALRPTSTLKESNTSIISMFSYSMAMSKADRPKGSRQFILNVTSSYKIMVHVLTCISDTACDITQDFAVLHACVVS